MYAVYLLCKKLTRTFYKRVLLYKMLNKALCTISELNKTNNQIEQKAVNMSETDIDGLTGILLL